MRSATSRWNISVSDCHQGGQSGAATLRSQIGGTLKAPRISGGLDIEDCRAILGNPAIEDEALRRVFLLTKGCPLFLRAIREGDDATLRANSRFTTAEIRLLLYSGGSVA